VDVDRVNGYDAVRLARAQVRMVAHAQAGLLATVAAVARCQPGGPHAPVVRRAEPGLESAVDEVAFGLTLTRAAAGTLLDLAEDTVRHPGLHQALTAGVLDLAKLRVITEAVRPLAPAEAAAVVARILPQVAELTTGQLRCRLARLVLCADPGAAARRREQALARRRVLHYAEADGTATLAATGLPIERAAVAWHRLDDLARTAKRGGDTRSLDHLRADVLVDLLAGVPTGTAAPTAGHGAHPGPADPGPARWPGGLHLIAPLDTLLGLADEPGDLPGWGPIAADVLRRLAADPTGEARMQVSVLDEQGRLIGTVRTARHRLPTAGQARHVRARDVSCRAPGCRAPAYRCDLDHTRDHAAGGATLVANLGPLCRHHHRGKHLHGFQLRQPNPGHFVWTTPLGHTYHRREQHPP
jgi:hypothetical protein